MRCESQEGTGGRERLPIPPSILRNIKSVWDLKVSDLEIFMLWTACCLAYFGFLRIGEITVSSDTTYDSSVHLSRGDLAVDNTGVLSVLRVTIKQSKTDPFCRGVNLFLGKKSTDLCPVAAILNYLVLRGRAPGPLFQFKDGRYLTR